MMDLIGFVHACFEMKPTDSGLQGGEARKDFSIRLDSPYRVDQNRWLCGAATAEVAPVENAG